MTAKTKKKKPARSKAKPAKKSAKKSARKAARKATRKSAKKAAKKSVKKAVKKLKRTKPVKKKSATKAKKTPKKAAAKPAKKKSPAKVKAKAKKSPVKAKRVKAPAKVSKAPAKPKVKKPTVSKPAAAPAAPAFQVHRTSLKAGDKAPYFHGTDQNGNVISLDNYAGKKVILYFYPKDDTEGCTKEACNLRDEYRVLGDKNYDVVGVSADDQSSHAAFAGKYNLPFPLIADTSKTIIMDYDVWGPKMMMGNVYDGIVRTTFVIDEQGTIERVIYDVDTAAHAQQIMNG